MQEVATIKSWININASPFAWQRILFKLLPEFKKEGFFFHTIKDDSKLSPPLLEKISEALFETYKLKLSREFFQTSTQEITTVSEKESEDEKEVNQNELLQTDDKNIIKNDLNDSDGLA